MSLFDYISRRLFHSGKNINVHETLERSLKFMDAYSAWLREPQFKPLKEDLLKSWGYQMNHMKSPVDMLIYATEHAKGFIVYPEYWQALIQLSFLMEYLKDRMLQESYRLVHADRIIEGKNDHLEIRERYLLKPGLSKKEPFSQMYGNVHIELLKYDKKEIRLKFLVNVYSDRKYAGPWEFNDLMSLLFDN